MNFETHQRYFRHDAFISYAHRDNETGIVRALHAQLEEFLSHSLDWEPSVWLDERSLDEKADLEEQIRAGLRESAVLIIVTSETVESRRWCRDEMGWYLNDANLQRVPLRRTFPVFLPFDSIERLPRWAKDLSDLSGIGPTILDPERQELAAAQDLTAHGDYWYRLYGWFQRLSDAIATVHATYHELWKPRSQSDEA
jgi:hypothetical protein